MAQKMMELKIKSVKTVFKPYIFEAEIDGDIHELLSPYDLLQGIKDLGIDDLQKIEVTYLMKVLSKPDLEGNILLQELLQIMENFGLSGEAESEAPIDEMQPEEAEETSNASPPKKKNEKPLDLSKLDQKSVKMMVMLMLYLLEQNMSTAEFF